MTQSSMASSSQRREDGKLALSQIIVQNIMVPASCWAFMAEMIAQLRDIDFIDFTVLFRHFWQSMDMNKQ